MSLHHNLTEGLTHSLPDGRLVRFYNDKPELNTVLEYDLMCGSTKAARHIILLTVDMDGALTLQDLLYRGDQTALTALSWYIYLQGQPEIGTPILSWNFKRNEPMVELHCDFRVGKFKVGK